MFLKFPLKDRYIIAAIIVKTMLPAVIIDRKILYKVWELDNYLNCNMGDVKDHALHEGYLLDSSRNKKRLILSADTTCVPKNECSKLNVDVLNRCYLTELVDRAYGWYQEDFLVITDIK